MNETHIPYDFFDSSGNKLHQSNISRQCLSVVCVVLSVCLFVSVFICVGWVLDASVDLSSCVLDGLALRCTPQGPSAFCGWVLRSKAARLSCVCCVCVCLCLYLDVWAGTSIEMWSRTCGRGNFGG